MKQTTLILIGLLALAIPCMAGQQGAGSTLKETVQSDQIPDLPPLGPSAPESAAPGLAQIAAQLMLVTMHGTQTADALDREFLRLFTPGGVIISEVLTSRSAARYVKDLRELPTVKASGAPLLIGTNIHELPRYVRGVQNTTFPEYPSPLTLAAANDIPRTEEIGTLIAKHLKVMGFNMHFGPSLALAPSLPGAAGTSECYGSDPEVAASIGKAILVAFAEDGLVGVPTQFPGGAFDALENGPAVLLTTRENLAERELLPFIKAIEAGAPMIHVANTFAPGVNPSGSPASLSAPVMKDLLRRDLGFEGVIVAGPLDAPELGRAITPDEAAVRALQSGADMLYWDSAGRNVVRAIEAIVYAVENGQITRARLESALQRVTDLKAEHEIGQTPVPDEEAALRISLARQDRKRIYALESRAITLVRNRNNALPLSKKSSMPIGITGSDAVTHLKNALEEHIKPVFQQPLATVRHLGKISDIEIQRALRGASKIRTIICVFGNLPKDAGQAELVTRLKAQGANVVVVLFGYPETLSVFNAADAIVLAYGHGSSFKNMTKAVAEILVGEAPARIRTLTQDLRLKAGSPETFDTADVVRVPAGRLPVSVDPPFFAGLAATYPPGPAIKSAAWDFGDGKRAKGLRVEHTFKEPGRYPITLTVKDTTGERLSETYYATVE